MWLLSGETKKNSPYSWKTVSSNDSDGRSLERAKLAVCSLGGGIPFSLSITCHSEPVVCVYEFIYVEDSRYRFPLTTMHCLVNGQWKYIIVGFTSLSYHVFVPSSPTDSCLEIGESYLAFEIWSNWWKILPTTYLYHRHVKKEHHEQKKRAVNWKVRNVILLFLSPCVSHWCRARKLPVLLTPHSDEHALLELTFIYQQDPSWSQWHFVLSVLFFILLHLPS